MTSFLRNDRSRPVAIWLFVVAAMVFAMVIVGGATRLTGSGLSITEWRPITGVLPPMSHEAWLAEFQKYQQIPQYRQVNAGMSLAGFQAIYWWEWAHRLLGRVIGVVFLLPFVIFLLSRSLPRRLVWRCLVLFGLGALQGALGWWMVSSGLSERVSVAPERLAAHLGLALILFCALIWTGLEAWAGAPRPAPAGRWPLWASALAAGVLLQIMLGALVAGNDAGFVYNDWPLMNGQLFPDDYAGRGVWGTIAHSAAATQFHHRIGAYLLFLAAWAAAITAKRAAILPRDAKRLAHATAGLVTLQAILGIVTLINVSPVGLAIAHQALAAVVLAAALAFAWRVRRV
jgi:heme a synthase